MNANSIWECETQFLAEQWRPLFVKEVMAFYYKRKSAVRCEKTAFADVYQKYFLNPSTQEIQ